MTDPTPRRFRAAVLLLAMVLLGSVGTRPAEAQGLHAGLASSRLTDVPGLESRRGVVLGATFSFLEFGRLSLTPGLMYVQKGARLSVPTEAGIEDLRIDWFEIPVLIEFGEYVFDSPVRPSVFVGPYFALRTGCSFGFADGSDRSEDCFFAGLQEIGIDGAIDENDFGWTAGAGLEYYTGRIGNISIEARYSASFSDIMRSGSVSEAGTRSWILTAGIRPTVR